jgi:hypothetical protein
LLLGNSIVACSFLHVKRLRKKIFRTSLRIYRMLFPPFTDDGKRATMRAHRGRAFLLVARQPQGIPRLPTVRFFLRYVSAAPGKPGARTRRGWCGSEPEPPEAGGGRGRAWVDGTESRRLGRRPGATWKAGAVRQRSPRPEPWR